MRKFLIKLVIFALIFVAFDNFVGLIGDRIMHLSSKRDYNSMISMTNYNLNYSIPDIAIIGSSPALTAYVPKILKDSIYASFGERLIIRNTSCYYQGLYYYLVELKSLNARGKPRLVVLDINPFQLTNFEDKYEVLKPFYHKNIYVKEMFNERASTVERAALISNMYCLNTAIFQMVAGLLKETGNLGYFPQFFRHSHIGVETIDDAQVDADKMDLLDEIIQFAQSQNINIIVAISPSNVHYSHSSEVYCTIVEKCSQNNIPFYDFSEDSIFQNRNLFSDKAHLHDSGAQIFTEYFFTTIQEPIIQDILR